MVDVSASSHYEAAVLGLKAFEQTGWSDHPVGEMDHGEVACRQASAPYHARDELAAECGQPAGGGTQVAATGRTRLEGLTGVHLTVGSAIPALQCQGIPAVRITGESSQRLPCYVTHRLEMPVRDGLTLKSNLMSAARSVIYCLEKVRLIRAFEWAVSEYNRMSSAQALAIRRAKDFGLASKSQQPDG